MAVSSRRCVGVTLAGVAAAVTAVCSPAPTTPVELRVPGRASATPSLAARASFVTAVWSATAPGGSSDVYAAVSRDSGQGFGAPMRVNSVDGAARVNGEQPPRVTLLDRAGADPAIVVVWTARGEHGTTLLESRSDDGGVSFTPQSVVAGTDAVGNRGWEAIATTSSGAVAAIWLDHREMAAEASSGGAHHHHVEADAGGSAPDSSIRAQMSKLYFGVLNGTAPQVVTGGVCYCCKTTLATAADGSIFAAWRHVYPGNIRDIAFTMSRDGGRTFATPLRISDDGWILNGCPENGPSIAVDVGGRVHVAWPTLIQPTGGEPTLALFYSMSPDGRTFTPRQPLPTEGTPRHVQIAVSAAGEIVAAWDEGSGGLRRLAFARGTPSTSGTVRFTRSADGADIAATYPVVAYTDNAMLAAWTSGGTEDSVIRVRPIAFRDR
jgi:hypothetical protein